MLPFSGITVEARKNFSLTSEEVSFDNAFAKCAEMGLHFARVETDEDEEKVRSLLQQQRQSFAWIALKKSIPFFYDPHSFSQVSNIVQYLRWSNGSHVTNFTLTKNDLAFYENHHHCITINISSGEAKLMDTECALMKKALCMERKLTSEYVYCTLSYFPTGPVFEDSKRYKSPQGPVMSK